jgi:hypothetical protein
MYASSTTTPACLAEVLRYRHPGVVRRYRKEYGGSQLEADEVFRQTLKWLYLCHRALTEGPEGFACAISSELEKIDRMWHTFLLFTMDYADFCDRYFGTFLHHVPEEAEAEVPVDEDVLRTRIARQFGLVYDVLGESTLIAWYEECRYAVSA